ASTRALERGAGCWRRPRKTALRQVRLPHWRSFAMGRIDVSWPSPSFRRRGVWPGGPPGRLTGVTRRVGTGGLGGTNPPYGQVGGRGTQPVRVLTAGL